ncbi:MAG: type II toxin-antitoxin system Phd/YefM family antitoxin [Sinobacteraceae bacterium]|nr:type II toxin-antitoxin system Phd/YefM family antitoxin [Nevskiaceae bacterium]
MRIIAATELARHTRAVLDSVVNHGATVAVERNHVTVARIVPAEPSLNAAQALAGLAPMLTVTQAQNWLQQSRAGFDDMLHDPWA